MQVVMQRRILIKNGHIVDPANGISAIGNVYVEGDRIVEAFPEEHAHIIIDAKGKYVFPGLIDFHTHVFYKSTEIGINPDTSMLCQGITSVVDAGSFGSSNVESFIDNVIHKCDTTVQAYLSFCSAGLATMKYHENYSPSCWDLKMMPHYVKKYKDCLLGLKIRMSKPLLGPEGAEVFRKAVKTAHDFGLHICVHTTNPSVPMAEIADLLQAGDVLAHVFHGTATREGDTIIDADGKVNKSIIAAQKRGVIMDTASGGAHWNFVVAEPAIAQGFLPNIISTDITVKSVFKDPVFGLPYVMSKYFIFGLTVEQIVERVTANPAKLMVGEERRGTLSVGSLADIAVFDIIDKEVTFSDSAKDTRVGHKLFIPMLTLKEGEIVYRNISFLE